MSPSSQTEVVTMFADPDQDVWGIAVGSDAADWLVGVRDAVPSPIVGSLRLSEPRSESPTVATPGSGDLLALHRTNGEIEVEGRTYAIDATAITCAAVNTNRTGSVRLVAAWFPHARMLGLAAVRPRSANGQDRDTIEVIGDDGAAEQRLSVFDPRLSATYDGSGAPRRVALELWVGRDDEDEQQSLRMTGETTDSQLAAMEAEPSLHAYRIACHSRGERGLGVFAMASIA